MSPLSARSAIASCSVADASAGGAYHLACASSLSTTNGGTPMPARERAARHALALHDVDERQLANVAREHHDDADRALALIAQLATAASARCRSAAPIASVSSNTERSRVSATSSSTSSEVTGRSPANRPSCSIASAEPRQIARRRYRSGARPPTVDRDAARLGFLAQPRLELARRLEHVEPALLARRRERLEPLVELRVGATITVLGFGLAK